MSRRYLTLLLLVLPVAGCSERPLEFAVVEGTVTRGGRPMPYIDVVFFGDEGTIGPRSSGITDSSGRYRLETETGQGGAVIGRHRVCLSDRDPAFQASRSRIAIPASMAGKVPPELAGKLAPPNAGRSNTTQPVSRVPEAYGKPWETPLRAEVHAGAQTLDFQIP